MLKYIIATTIYHYGEIKMKKFLLILLSLMLPCSLISCNNDEPGRVYMNATVTALGEKIEVEVTKSNYTSGPHLVIIGNNTEIYNKKGEKVTRDAISVGDSLEIIYNGQVMLSYPPQIVAHKITIE